jgi:hypothetical protein
VAKKLLAGSELVPGKLYTFWGKANKDIWAMFVKRPHHQAVSTLVAIELVYLGPLEPFVFLERTLSDLVDPTIPEALYDYKLLTGNGIVGWLTAHDDDLLAMGIGFVECITTRKQKV